LNQQALTALFPNASWKWFRDMGPFVITDFNNKTHNFLNFLLCPRAFLFLSQVEEPFANDDDAGNRSCGVGRQSCVQSSCDVFPIHLALFGDSDSQKVVYCLLTKSYRKY
jgi:hypothetical protein